MTARFNRVTTHDGSPYGVSWHCPGCDDEHVVPTTGANAWGFNEDLERPTLTPSILYYPHKTFLKDSSVGDTPRCHTFIREGRIEFLSDCTHALAGQTVDVPEIQPTTS